MSGPAFPKNTLTLKRRQNTDALEQWTASEDGGAITVHRLGLDNSDLWQDIQISTGFTDLAEAPERSPELRTLSRARSVSTRWLPPPWIRQLSWACSRRGRRRCRRELAG